VNLLKGVFITGTDTGVGKTIVSAVIIRALIRKGIKVGAMKPLETGCKKAEGTVPDLRTEQGGVPLYRAGVESELSPWGSTLIPADGMFLREMAEMDDPIDLVTPVRFEQPLAPMVAADIEKKVVDLDAVRGAYKALSGKYDFMVVEGVGGLLVPIMRSPSPATRHPSPFFVADLIKDLNLPVIIVACLKLGTINHTLLTVNQALREGLNVSGVIISQSALSDNTISAKTNPDAMRELCSVPILGTVPYLNIVNRENIEIIAADVGRWLLSERPFSDGIG